MVRSRATKDAGFNEKEDDEMETRRGRPRERQNKMGRAGASGWKRLRDSKRRRMIEAR